MRTGKEFERNAGSALPVWAAIACFVVLFFAGAELLGLGAQVLMAGLQEAGAGADGMLPWVVSEVSMLLALALALAVMFRMEHRPWSDLGLVLKGHGKGLWLGAALAGTVYGLGFGFSLVVGAVEVTGFHWEAGRLLVSFFFFGLVALFEEGLVRGYLLGRMLRGGVNRFLALFLSACFFGAVHLFNPNVSVLPLVNLVLAGMLLGAPVLYTRNLWFSVSLHLFWNWLQGPVLGYPVSGMDAFAPLLQLRLSEDTLLNGGAFGFEGSLLCTGLLLLTTGWILYRGERGRLPAGL